MGPTGEPGLPGEGIQGPKVFTQMTIHSNQDNVTMMMIIVMMRVLVIGMMVMIMVMMMIAVVRMIIVVV